MAVHVDTHSAGSCGGWYGDHGVLLVEVIIAVSAYIHTLFNDSKVPVLVPRLTHLTLV